MVQTASVLVSPDYLEVLTPLYPLLLDLTSFTDRCADSDALDLVECVLAAFGSHTRKLALDAASISQFIGRSLVFQFLAGVLHEVADDLMTEIRKLVGVWIWASADGTSDLTVSRKPCAEDRF
jgi:hypothetical protein